MSKSQYFSTAVFEHLEQQELVCLDDLQAVIGNSEWEIALFDLFNRIKANGKTLLVVSAEQSPTALPVKLPDLASRLKWGESYQLISTQRMNKNSSVIETKCPSARHYAFR